MGGGHKDGGIENGSHGIVVVVSGEMCRGKFIAKRARSKRLDFMAVLQASAAFSEKGSGVVEGVAMTRWRGINRALPQVREHRRSGVTRNEASKQQAHDEE